MKTQTQFWHDFLKETENQRKNRRGNMPSCSGGKWLERIYHESNRTTYRNMPGTIVFKFENLDLSGFDFSYTYLKDVFFENCSFKGAQFNDSHVGKSWFEQCNFTDAEFFGARFLDSNLKRCVFEGASFLNARLTRCSFKYSTLKTARLYGCQFSQLTKHPVQYPAANTHYQIGSKLYKLNLAGYAMAHGEEILGMVADNKTIIIATARHDIPLVHRLVNESELFSLIDTLER